MRDEFIWVEKYRPKTIDDCILPESTKKTFREFLVKGEIPNLLPVSYTHLTLPTNREV